MLIIITVDRVGQYSSQYYYIISEIKNIVTKKWFKLSCNESSHLQVLGMAYFAGCWLYYITCHLHIYIFVIV